MEGETERQKDRQTLFYRTLPATKGGPKNQDISSFGGLKKFS